MAGEEKEETKKREEGFAWDADSNLFYHASTGFYHDPIAGWYYSSTDGLYYAFQDGNYVLLESKMVDEGSEPNPSQVNECSEETSPCEDNNPESYSRPSEWLDEILINQYLSGYPKPQTNSDDQPTDLQSEIVLSSEEESWLAQYGQVDKNNNTIPLNETIKAVDLWDWELVKEGQNRKITGRLAGQSSKLHPSSAGFLKTAAIRQTHLDLVRVSSGKVYRLRTPSGKYLATLLAYDSSNPTKDWGFPTLSTDSQLENITIDSIINLDQSNNNEEKQVYRDRAAERRRLHGINGIAPFQKGVNNNNNNNNDDDDNKMDLECDATSAQEEARQLAFGTGSYARKIMQNMGWKDGEALGSSEKGIVEPIHNVGNKGQAGLGFKN